MSDPLAAAGHAADELRGRAGVDRFDVAVVLGSGWKQAAADLGEPIAELAATELPGFVASGVEGHEGTDPRGRARRALRAALPRQDASLRGPRRRRGRARRAHRGRSRRHTVVLTNASGAIARGLTPGEPVLISDHISLTAVSPLVGGHFVDLTDLYAPRLRDLAREVDPSLREGVYAHWPGPAFETPAEIRMLRTLGADLVGMSTVPEAIAAHALGAEVLAISLPTNWAAGLGDEKLSHEEVRRRSRRRGAVCRPARGVLDRLGTFDGHE